MALKDTMEHGDEASRGLDTLGARLSLVLVAFIVVATTLVGGFEYLRGRRVLVRQVSAELEARERLVGDRLQRALDQRRRLVAVWPELEAAQDLAVDDVDKRLASSLIRLSQSFGGQALALGVGVADTIVAASAIPWIGEYAGDRPWARIPLPSSGEARLRLTHDPRLGTVVATVAPVTARTTGAPLGRIVLLSPWGALVDEAAGEYGPALEVRDTGGRLVGGTAAVSGDQLRAPPLGLAIGDDTVRLVLGTPFDEAIQPLHRTRRQFALLTLVVLAVTVPAALLLAHSNTAALRQLTASARQVQAAVPGRRPEAASRPLDPSTAAPATGPGPDFTPPPRAPREVRVLASALSTMVQRLEASRVDLARQESLAAMGTMAAVLAHEIRTPLSVLRGSADMLSHRVGDDARGRELVSFLEEEIARLERLVNDLLVFARPRPPDAAPTDLANVAQRAIRALGRKAEGAGVALAPSLIPVPVHGDEEQLYQIALNLVSNAIEASPVGGKVRVRTGPAAGDGGTKGEPLAELVVEDDGSGIPEAQMDEVWMPFFTTRRGGTGLGLPLVRRIARAHGGEAVIERPQGGGTRVVVTLPALEGESA